jgi:phosphonopyruvate decarboxylase
MTAHTAAAAALTGERFCESLAARGMRFYTGVPCSYFTDAIAYANEHYIYVNAANEGAALAVAAGAALGGARPVVLLQNSGFGNLVNPLTSLSLVYEIPALLFISLRAWPDELSDEPQHRIIGRELANVLTAFGVHNAVMPTDPDAFEAALDEADAELRRGRVAALLVRKGSIAGPACASKCSRNGSNADRADARGSMRSGESAEDRPLSRAEAVAIVADAAGERDAIVSTTGEISRELFAQRDRPGNFYMQGSMGHAPSIALGAALARTGVRVFALDGDGAALMHLGALSTIGAIKPRDFVHVILDNEAYATTGNQPTTSSVTRLEDVALACGYRAAWRCTTREELVALLRRAREQPGPSCIVVKTNLREATGLPRVTSAYAPADTTRGFTAFLADGAHGD